MKFVFYLLESALGAVAFRFYGWTGLGLTTAMFVVSMLDENYRGQKALDKLASDIERTAKAMERWSA